MYLFLQEDVHIVLLQLKLCFLRKSAVEEVFIGKILSNRVKI